MSNHFAISPLVFLIGFLSFQSNPSVNNLADYSEQEVFQGIFFGDGAFAENVPQLAKFGPESHAKNAKDLEQAREFQANIMEQVDAKNPGYITSLHSAVLSGSHVKIQAAIYKGAKILDNVVWSVDKNINQEVRTKIMEDLGKKVNANTSTEELNNLVDNYLEGLTADNPDMARAACVLVLAVVVAVAVGVFLWVVYIVEASVERTPLANEQIINSIANMR
ncbi:MAG: hypothetical protein AB8F74_21145 [Saprospiraceae bacterium]